ncbi:MAG: NADH-quinone oxidoreductase subunit NuoF [Deltaproteobacteria bacterium]|nr:NADH-quinone oxidoreductase subunit NuoF [Deltaproteobacteria bacterium]
MLQETPILTKNIRSPGYDGSLEAYQKAGGHKALEKALKSMTPETVIEAVKESGLRGRGGAGFPTGMKWGFMPKNTGRPSYLVCNADEAEPGTFKDHFLINRDPHLFLEGLIIGSYAIGCHHAYVYIRGRSQAPAARLQTAIDNLYKAKLLGKAILGTGFDLDITIHRGAGAYICGEETALLESLEGKRGQPRVKPPFPATHGFNACPTSVNNVESLANVPIILNMGPDAFKKLGSTNNSGTRLVGISGHIKNPGIYEVEMGANLKSIIYDLGGGMRDGKQIKVVIPGGTSSNPLKPEEIDIAYDFDAVAKAGSMLGTCSLIVLDEDTDIVDLAYRTIVFFNHESCGQCTPCREGTFWLKNLVRDFHDNLGDQGKIDRIRRVAATMFGTSLCALGDAAAGPMKAFVEKYPEEFRKHFI